MPWQPGRMFLEPQFGKTELFFRELDFRGTLNPLGHCIPRITVRLAREG
jgi:hypothetical protein